MAQGLQQAINYMIPAVGTPRMYAVNQTFVAGTPVTLDFRNISGGGIDGQPFRPSGVFIDNSAGVAALQVVINEISYVMTCPAGGALNLQFPAPTEITATITGDGVGTVVFVDFPVIPYRSF